MAAPETRPLDTIQIDQTLRDDLGDVTALARSIAQVGLLHPVVTRPDGSLIAGERRLAACRSLGWTAIPVTVATTLDDALLALQAARDENVERKALTPAEAVALARRLEPLERAAAKRRQAAAGPSAGRGRKATGPAESAQAVGPARQRIARGVGLSHATLAEATAVVEAAEADPDQYGDLVARMNRTGKVHGAYRRLQQRQLAAQLDAQPLPPPEGPFEVLVADPPWRFASAGELEPPYPTLTLEEIAAVVDPAWAADDAVCWLWTTNTHLPDAFEVLRRWGFAYKTCLTWVKDQANPATWLRGQTEHCLLGARGKPTVFGTTTATVLHAARREHSRKPDEFFALVEQICPGRKLELFARTERPGWRAWGVELDRFPARGSE